MKLTLKNVFLSVGIFAFTFALVGALSTNKAEAAPTTCTAELSGDWNNNATWDAACQVGTFPVAGDTVIIPSGFTVNVNVVSAAASVTINNTGAATGLAFTGGTLAVSGATILNAPSGTGTTTVAIGAGTLTTGSLTIAGGDGSKISQVTVAAGTLTVNATDLTLSGTAANARLTSTGASTISVTTGNLTNGGTIAFTGAGATLSVGTGTTTTSNLGSITLSDTTGTYTFTGLLTVLSGGVYNETTALTAVTFSGGITNAGTVNINIAGTHTFGGTVTNTGTFNHAHATIPTFAASASGTINYTGAGQTVQVIGYHDLGLSGTDTKVLGALVIGGTLTISGATKASLTGDSTANKLTLGSSSTATGTWGSSGSSPLATHINDTYFLAGGTKMLTVTTGSTSSGQIVYAPVTPADIVPTADTTAPSGTSISINAGVSTTSSLSSTLTFTAIDATEMMISNDSGFAGASWESYATSKAWTLTSGDGVKTVYARFRDAVGNMTTAVIDAITVSGSGTVAVPSNEPTQGCSGGNLFNTSTGAACVNNETLQIPGCGNSVTGFSVATGDSCAGNHVTTTTYNFGTVTLKNGSKGEAVKELQRFLNAKLNLGLVIDGSLGPKTIAVIKQWQKDNGLVSDGLVGAKTKALMNQ